MVLRDSDPRGCDDTHFHTDHTSRFRRFAFWTLYYFITQWVGTLACCGVKNRTA